MPSIKFPKIHTVIHQASTPSQKFLGFVQFRAFNLPYLIMTDHTAENVAYFEYVSITNSPKCGMNLSLHMSVYTQYALHPGSFVCEPDLPASELTAAWADTSRLHNVAMDDSRSH